MRGDILNAGDNVDDEEIFGFSESFFKISPTNIDEYTKSKLLNMRQENIRPQTNIEINDKPPDERYHKNNIDDKESDEKKQINKIDEKKYLRIKKSRNCKI